MENLDGKRAGQKATLLDFPVLRCAMIIRLQHTHNHLGLAGREAGLPTALILQD